MISLLLILSCTNVSPTITGPTAPGKQFAVVMKSPAANSGKSLSITVEVTGVNSGDVIKLYSDKACSVLVQTGTAVNGVADFTLNLNLFGGYSSASYGFYATHAPVSGVPSNCTSTGATYLASYSTGAGFPLGKTDVLFGKPTDVAVDSLGNLYVVDSLYNMVTILNASGNFVNQFQTNLQSSQHIAVSPSFNIYVSDPIAGSIIEFDPTGKLLNQVSVGNNQGLSGLAVDSLGNVFVSLSAASVIYKYNSKLGGNFTIPVSALNSPQGIAFDSKGNLYVVEQGLHRVSFLAVSGTSPNLSFGSPVGHGSLGSNGLFSPTGVTVDGSGNIYVTDTGNNRVQVFDKTWTLIQSYIYDSDLSQSQSLLGIAVFNNNIFVADSLNSQIVSPSISQGSTVWNVTGPQGPNSGQFLNASAIAIDKQTNEIYIADSGNYRIQKFDSHGTYQGSLGTHWVPGTEKILGSFTTPQLYDQLTPTLFDTYLYSAISTGGSHFCAIRISTGPYTLVNGLVCWGDNSRGELGDGTTTTRVVPTPVNPGTAFSKVATGGLHTCAIDSSNNLYCWGDNTYGQVGVGTSLMYSSPQLVGANYISVVTGATHTCAIDNTNTLYCWGSNAYGQIGNGGGTTNVASPTLVSINTGVAQVVAGAIHTCAVDRSSPPKDYCWGSNNDGQLGIGNLVPSSKNAPYLLTSSFVSMAAGGLGTCGFMTGNVLYCWGSNESGQLLEAQQNFGCSPPNEETSPHLLDNTGKYKSVVMGGAHICGLTTSNSLDCWGSNYQGEVGNNSGLSVYFPTSIDTGFTYSNVAAANSNDLLNKIITPTSEATCGITLDSHLRCWGAIYRKQNAINGIAVALDPGGGHLSSKTLYITNAGFKSLDLCDGGLLACPQTAYTDTADVISVPGLPGANGFFNSPTGVAVLPYQGQEAVFAADMGNSRFLTLTYQLTFGVGYTPVFSSQIGQSGIVYNGLSGVAVDNSNYLYGADAANNRIVIFNQGLAQQSPYEIRTADSVNSSFKNPNALAFDSANTMYVLDSGNNRFVKLIQSGSSWNAASLGYQPPTGTSPFNQPNGIATDSHGNIYVLDAKNGRVLKFDANGNELFY